MRPFLLTLTVAAVALLALAYGGAERSLFERPSFMYISAGVAYGVTAAIFVFLYRVSKPESFLQLYLLTMVGKLIVFFLFNLVIVLADEAVALENVVFFMVSYFVFTGIEVGFLYHRISR